VHGEGARVDGSDRVATLRRVEWSGDGTRLLVVGARAIRILGGSTGRLVASTLGAYAA
jgi:hypothetical protein